MNYRGAKVNIDGVITRQELHSAWLSLLELKFRGQTYFTGNGISIISNSYGDIINIQGRKPKKVEEEKIKRIEERQRFMLVDVFTYDTGTLLLYEGNNWICGVTGKEKFSYYNAIFDSQFPLLPYVLSAGRLLSEKKYTKGAYYSWNNLESEESYSFYCIPAEKSIQSTKLYPVGQFFSQTLSSYLIVELSSAVDTEGEFIADGFSTGWNKNDTNPYAYGTVNILGSLIRSLIITYSVSGIQDYTYNFDFTQFGPGYEEIINEILPRPYCTEYFPQCNTFPDDHSLTHTVALPTFQLGEDPMDLTTLEFDLAADALNKVTPLAAHSHGDYAVYEVREEAPDCIVSVDMTGIATDYLAYVDLTDTWCHYAGVWTATGLPPPYPPYTWQGLVGPLTIAHSLEVIGYYCYGIRTYRALYPRHDLVDMPVLREFGDAGEYETELYDSVTSLDDETMLVYIKGIPPIFSPYIESTFPNTLYVKINDTVVLSVEIGSSLVTMRQAMIYKVKERYVYIVAFAVGEEEFHCVYRKETDGTLTDLSEGYDPRYHYLRVGEALIKIN